MGSERVPDTPLLGTAHTCDLSCDRHPDQVVVGDDYEDALVRLRQRVSPVG